jgi:formate dehydrogenase maturation protein FdhE
VPHRSWASHVERARKLASSDLPSRNLLAFYAALLDVQRAIHEQLAGQAAPLSGALHQDLPVLRPLMPPLLEVVATAGPTSLARAARELSGNGDSSLEPLLVDYWQTLSTSDAPGRAFFAKACLQPYARWLVDSKIPVVRDRLRDRNRCPACGGLPQAGIMQRLGSERATRSLLCALCLSSWHFPRVVCASCGERDERKLGYYNSPSYPHVRVEVCDTCRHYIKSVDLSVLGIADPLVDELAAASLDLWAREHDYVKIELNLVGL